MPFRAGLPVVRSSRSPTRFSCAPTAAGYGLDLRVLVAKNDLVAAHLSNAGTFEHPLYGVPPTGKFARR